MHCISRRMKPSVFYILYSSLLLLPLLGAAQRYYPTGIQSKELIGLQLGTTSFYGDVEGLHSFGASSPHIGLSYEYRPTAHLGLRATGLWYKVAASDSESKQQDLRDRNLSFTSSNWEGSLITTLYLRPYRAHEFYNRQQLNAYVLAGMGFTLYNPKTEYLGNSWELRNLQTEGVSYSRAALVIPFGGGLLFKVSPHLDLGLELTYHHTFSDYLDDVSSVYRSQDAFTDPIAAALADRRVETGMEPTHAGAVRGNSDVNDGYAMFSLRTVYYLSRYQFWGKEIKKIYQ